MAKPPSPPREEADPAADPATEIASTPDGRRPPAAHPAGPPAEHRDQAAGVESPAATASNQLLVRIEALEQNLSELKNVQELSELLSIKYNPFLDIEEEQPSEGRHSTSQLIQASLGARKRPWEEASPEFMEAWAHASVPPASNGHRAPANGHGRPANGHTHPLSHEPVDARAHAPAGTPPATADAAKEEQERRFRPGGERSMYNASSRHVANARESFLAMHWFTYLSQGTQPSIIFLYLDYYRYVGWIDADAHEWLWKLAEGVATPRPGAEWADFGMDVQRLSSQHLRNLRFIDKLLGTTLQHGEAEYLRQTVDMLLMED